MLLELLPLNDVQPPWKSLSGLLLADAFFLQQCWYICMCVCIYTHTHTHTTPKNIFMLQVVFLSLTFYNVYTWTCFTYRLETYPLMKINRYNIQFSKNNIFILLLQNPNDVYLILTYNFAIDLSIQSDNIKVDDFPPLCIIFMFVSRYRLMNWSPLVVFFFICFKLPDCTYLCVYIMCACVCV